MTRIEAIRARRARYVTDAGMSWRQVVDMDDLDHLLNRYAELEAALRRNRQAYENIKHFRRIADNRRYGALTIEEIEHEIDLINAALEQPK